MWCKSTNLRSEREGKRQARQQSELEWKNLPSWLVSRYIIIATTCSPSYVDQEDGDEGSIPVSSTPGPVAQEVAGAGRSLNHSTPQVPTLQVGKYVVAVYDDEDEGEGEIAIITLMELTGIDTLSDLCKRTTLKT